MAIPLRNIDNALPITPERPKKQPKVSAPINIRTSDHAPVNDENVAPVSVTGEATVDYVSSQDLKPFPDPDTKIQGLVQGLDSKDWAKICESLNDARRFALHHSDLLIPVLEKVTVVVTKAMKNPRSALVKTTIMAASDVFTGCGDKLLDLSASDAFDQLLLQLLLKASQDKRFVCEEADKALSSLTQSVTPLPLLTKLVGYVNHSNLRVRAKAATSVSHCVSRMSPEELEEFGLVSLVQMAAELLNDRLPEAREAARSMAMSVYETFKKHGDDKQEEESWENFCQSNLAALRARSVIKITVSN